MSRKEFKIEDYPELRFEFRAFGQDFDISAKRMARLSIPVPESEWERKSEEVYILSRENDLCNVKIREGKIDIKSFVKSVDGLEQWCPVMKAQFPIADLRLINDVFKALSVKTPELDQPIYSCDDFIALVSLHSSLQAVSVHKQRSSYNVNNTICEIATVFINGAKILTISSESTKIEDIKATIEDIGLGSVENVNYIKAIKRIIGMNNQLLTHST
ncbi:hypothetical protein WG904_15955 [Pedobacter sp. Du54]|uniref:hypothetical protein n=1 Tax=Pedobacter anseongensis TaxID=3133439 RepID=UPI0030AE7FE6